MLLSIGKESSIRVFSAARAAFSVAEIEGRSAIDIDVRETTKDGTGTLSKVRLRFT